MSATRRIQQGSITGCALKLRIQRERRAHRECTRTDKVFSARWARPLRRCLSWAWRQQPHQHQPGQAGHDTMNIRIKKLHPDAIIPSYATAGAACFDLHAVECTDGFDVGSNHIEIWPGESATFRTGLAFEIPAGHVMLIYSRSGHGFSSDVSLGNRVGVIDSDYRGEVMVKLTRDSSGDVRKEFIVKPGDRIAQAMIVPIPRFGFSEAEELSATARGTGGFGSTGA